MTTEVFVSGELHRFIKECARDNYALKLILFFAAHPFTRFDRHAVTHALDHNNNRSRLSQALDTLVDRGVVTNASLNNGVPVFMLTEDTALRNLVMQMGKLGFREKENLLRPEYLCFENETEAYFPAVG